jgi:hypothetical protein
MFQVIFSIDYEIHGNGDGSPYKLMVEPTDRILKLFNKYGAKLTIFADVAEILKFKEFYELTGNDRFCYLQIIEQLKNAVIEGHDVQLHIHSSYFNAECVSGKWKQNWDEYNLAELSFQRINEIVKCGKQFLEGLLKPIDTYYCCNVFRAANWSMMPTQNIAKALIINEFIIDSSVFKYGKGNGRVKFDYSDANSEVIPWFADVSDINKEDKNGTILEVPIYCENRYLLSFINWLRIFRFIRAKFHKHQTYNNVKSNAINNNRKNILKSILNIFGKKYPWKLDINQAAGFQLINACRKIENNYHRKTNNLPIVLTGHSKTFIKPNSFFLTSFLKFIVKNNNYEFALYKDIEREEFRKI